MRGDQVIPMHPSETIASVMPSRVGFHPGSEPGHLRSAELDHGAGWACMQTAKSEYSARVRTIRHVKVGADQRAIYNGPIHFVGSEGQVKGGKLICLVKPPSILSFLC